MKRQHPFLSSLGFLFTAALLAGMALGIWRSGGMAFSPGRLSAKTLPGKMLQGFASHAEFESQCKRCHAPLETTQDVLCLNCHEGVKNQVANHQGTHGMIANVNSCASCHTEHQGKSFDPTMAAFSDFDHAVTSFSLVWHQVGYDAAPMACDACHTTEGDFAAPDEKCASCHSAHDSAFMLQHLQDFGANCSGCHDGADQMVKFDHSKTAFPLDGRHAGLRCADCHGLNALAITGVVPLEAQSFKTLPSDCVACHAEPQAHQGMFSTDCVACHSTSAWSPAKWDGKPFQHTSTTGFSLALHASNYDGSPMTCKDCHKVNGGQLMQAGLQFDQQICTDCHAKDPQKPEFISQHQDRFGSNCLDCHDGVDRMSNFDHAQFFPLDGVHGKIACESCHENKVFKGTPTECVKCHAEPAIHAGFFGLACQDCHSADAWTPASLKIHGFPLDHGGQGEVACKTCHTGAYVNYTCYGCHEHQPEPIQESHLQAGVSLEELPDCTSCHPTGLKDEQHR
jgi:predicted CXXCH cytochrome family protein